MRRFVSFPWISLASLTLTLVAYGSGCSSAKSDLHPEGDGGGGGQGDDGGSTSVPHALGTVVLGESHAPSGGTSTPLVLVSFIPDASALPQTCASQVGGCSFISAPQCGGSGSSCGQNETCTWDSACHPTCTAACTLACSAGQECYFASPNQPACRQTQTFDAGALAFAGTTTPITLFPPYQYQSTASGAPFLAGAQIEVQASGAAEAGFDKFDQKFTATTFLQTNLAMITAATVSGSGAVPITWTPGGDDITVTVSGPGGVASCTATDASGAFQVPHAVVTAALGPEGPSEVSFTVTRERDDWDKSATTHGTLTGATVQPIGWVELTTTSTESASFTVTAQPTCTGAGDTMCPDGCFDTQTDPYHCGSCTVVCSATDTCVSGQCTGVPPADCSTCQDTADTGECSSEFVACQNDGQCSEYDTCITGCAAGDTTCTSTCQVDYPVGQTDYDNLKNCICFTACTAACASATACQQ
jgi:hypothetical protein